MSKCPLCFSDLDQSMARWQCCARDCKSEQTPDAPLKAYLGREATIKQSRTERRPTDRRGAWRPRLEQYCAMCGQQLERTCTVCHAPMPKDVAESDVICVALAGARATGKSVSIGVMRMFLERLVEELGSSLDYEEKYSETDENAEYLKQMLTGRAYSATPPSKARSLLYSMGQLNGRRRYLALRDIAGEDLEKDSQLNLSFLGRADLVIFLFDPLAIQSIRDALESLLPQQGESGGEPQRVLQTVLRHIGTGRPHLAICLAKVDALQALAQQDSPISPVFANPGAAMTRESPTRRANGQVGYDEETAQVLSEEVRSTLMLLNGTVIVNMIENPATKVVLPHRFFATSALGDAANGELLPPHGITPFRVLDPLMWILNQKGVIPSIS